MTPARGSYSEGQDSPIARLEETGTSRSYYDKDGNIIEINEQGGSFTFVLSGGDEPVVIPATEVMKTWEQDQKRLESNAGDWLKTHNVKTDLAPLFLAAMQEEVRLTQRQVH